MNEITLKDYLATRTQSEAAIILDCNQSAVSHMLAANRDIRILLNKRGKPVGAYERKPIGVKAA